MNDTIRCATVQNHHLQTSLSPASLDSQWIRQESRSVRILEADSIALAHKAISCKCQQAKLPALIRVRAIALVRHKIATMDSSLLALIYRNQVHIHYSEAQVAHGVNKAMITSPRVVSDKIIRDKIIQQQRLRQWRLQVPWVQFLTGISTHTS